MRRPPRLDHRRAGRRGRARSCATGPRARARGGRGPSPQPRSEAARRAAAAARRSCAPRGHDAPAARPGPPTSPARGARAPACPSSCASTATAAAARRRRPRRPTGSSRRRSPTCSSTPAGAGAWSPSRYERDALGSRSPTTARRGRAAPRDGAGTGLVGMRERVAALRRRRSTPAAAPTAASASRATLPLDGDRRDPRPDRRRPGAGPRRVPRDARSRGPTSRSSGEAADGAEAVELALLRTARRRPHGHPHAAASTASRRPAGSSPTSATAPGCSSSPPSTSTSTSSARCAPARAASCSRTPRRTELARGHPASSPPARRCSRPSVTRRLIEDFVRRPAPAPSADGALASSPSASAEVLALVARGLSNAEIAGDAVRQRGDREDPRHARSWPSSACATASRPSSSPTRPGSSSRGPPRRQERPGRRCKTPASGGRDGARPP